jgi:hypothetical protein
MGGCGSGRQLDAKRVTSSFLCIDVAHLKKTGALSPGAHFTLVFAQGKGEIAGETEDASVWFSYAVWQDDHYKDEMYRVPLSYTPGQLGGERPWFLCPYINCDKRVRKLYIAHRLGCRHCLYLSFQSKNESHSERIARKADKVRLKLGWREGILHPEGHKPKRMHWQTFNRLVKQYRHFRRLAIFAMADEFPALQRFKNSLDKAT